MDPRKRFRVKGLLGSLTSRLVFGSKSDEICGFGRSFFDIFLTFSNNRENVMKK